MKQMKHTIALLMVYAAVLFFFLGTYAALLFAASLTGFNCAYMAGITAFCFVCLRASLRLLVQTHNN
jgi:hypothetical protein